MSKAKLKIKKRSDFPKTIEVFVSSKDIKGASRGSMYSCPIARAVQRNVETPFKVQVDGDYIKFYKDGTKWDDPDYVVRRYKLDKQTRKMVVNYDKGEVFKQGRVVAVG